MSSSGTGCGITVESDPLSEWEESVLKTEPILGVMPVEAMGMKSFSAS